MSDTNTPKQITVHSPNQPIVIIPLSWVKLGIPADVVIVAERFLRALDEDVVNIDEMRDDLNLTLEEFQRVFNKAIELGVLKLNGDKVEVYG